ncbi:hypothetical protein [Actinomyces timonensis]|uniref:hypothetical protein n=1 Tax=Actinomyces timonensis TaxID=1288391 RepID=UPI0003185C3B|nr:hypothetical protein [Actinomyces timonensis]
MTGILLTEAATPGSPLRDPEWLQAVSVLITALVGAVSGLIAAWVPQRRANKRIEEKVERAGRSADIAGRAAEDAHYAITNDHSSPLREDLDRQFSELLEDQRQTRLAVTQVAEAQRSAEITIGEALYGLRAGIDKLASRSKAEEASIRQEGARIAAEVENRLDALESARCDSCPPGATAKGGRHAAPPIL